MSEIKANKISPAIGTDVTMGDSGDTFTIPAGATIVNSGTATGFGEITKSASDPLITTNPAGGLGTIWLNTTSGELFSCTDATADDNIWTNTGEGTGNVSNPIVATGGTITTDGDFKVHTFTTSSQFIITSGSGTADYLVVAGGGGSICWNAGGGGAGGLRSTMTNTGGGASLESALSVTTQSYTVTVGAGGAGATTHVEAAFPALAGQTNGEDSVFGSITSLGGGLASYDTSPAPTGGSGAGSSFDRVPGSGTAGQGYAGGQGANSVPYQAGGGGAGAVGGIPSGGQGGNSGSGGVGVAVAITGSSVFYAGGGGGGGATNAGGNWNPGSGGNGGGGTGTVNAPNSGNNGTANTGGGGGASGRQTNTFFASGAGGSGVVIIRYRFQ